MMLKGPLTPLPTIKELQPLLKTSLKGKMSLLLKVTRLKACLRMLINI